MTEIDFTTATPEQLAAVEPGEFIRIVKEMSDKDVKEVMESANREPIIGAIFRRMPELFRELEAFRMLAFGIGMVLIMIWRPRGLLAHREPTMLLHRATAGASP